MDFKHAVNAAGRFLEKHIPDILTGASVIGVAVTAYLSGKTAIEADAYLKWKDAEKNLKGGRPTENLDKRDILELARISWPAFASGIMTAGLMVAATGINNSRLRSLGFAYDTLQAEFRDYRNTAIAAVGAKTEADIRRRMDRFKLEDKLKNELGTDENGETLHWFVDEISGREFIDTLSNVKNAQYELNKYFTDNGWAPVNLWFKLLDICDWNEAGLQIGWDVDDLYNDMGCYWIDFENIPHEEDGRIWYSICCHVDPEIPECDDHLY